MAALPKHQTFLWKHQKWQQWWYV